MEQNNTLIQDGWRSLRRGFADLTLGLWYIACSMSKALAHMTDNFIHKHPYACMLIEAMILLTLSFLAIRSARAERDHSNRLSYQIETSRDSLQVIVDSYIPNYGRQ